MRYVFGGLLASALVLVQASSVDQFRIGGVAPNLVLVLLVAWLVVRGLDDVLPMVAASGIAMGFIGLQTPGVVLLALLLPAVLLGVVREMHVVHSEIALVLAFVIVASLMYEVIVLASIMATGGVLDPVVALREAVLPAALANLAITIPVYALMRLARPAPTRRRLAY